MTKMTAVDPTAAETENPAWDAVDDGTFLERLLRAPNDERKMLSFVWAALTEIGAAPALYREAANRVGVPALTRVSPDGKLTDDEERDLKLALLLARVRIETDECVRGAVHAPSFSEALAALSEKSAATSALHPLLSAALKELAPTLHREARDFPESLKIVEIAPLSKAGDPKPEVEAAFRNRLQEANRIFRRLGAATAWTGECLRVRASVMDEQTLERLLSSFAAHECEHCRVRKIEPETPMPEFDAPYSPFSFHDAICYGGVRSWIAKHSDYDLWPIAKHEVERVFGRGKAVSHTTVSGGNGARE